MAEADTPEEAAAAEFAENKIKTYIMNYLFTLTCMLGFLNFCSRGNFGTIEEGDNKKPEGPVTSYTYSYSGTMAYPIDYYKLEKLEDGTVQLGYSHYDNDIHLIRVPEEVITKVTDMVEKYQLWKLKRSYRPKMEILDGYGWHVYIECEKGSISSGGTNAGPKSELSAGYHSINNYLDSLYTAAAPEDSLGIAYHNDWGN